MTNLAEKILSVNAKSPAKMVQIAQAAEDKKNRASGYLDAAARNVGINNDPDYINVEDENYDNAAIYAEQQGQDEYYRDASKTRGFGEAVVDSITGASNAFVQGLGGIVNAGVGVVSPEASNDVSEALRRHSLKTENLQSEGLLANRRAAVARNAATAAENKKLEEARVAAGENPLVAKLSRVGSDFLDTFRNADATGIQDVIAQGGGSLFSGGLLGKGLKAAKFGRASMPVAIGALEGGGAYNQTFEEAKSLGASDTEARDAALLAAGIQAPIGAATGLLVSKFEASPFSVGSFRNAAGNVLREAVEETTQSATGQVSSNVGLKTFVDRDRDLSEGVGENAALGLIGGTGIAGVVQGPGALYRGTVDGVKGAFNAILNRGDKLLANVKNEGPQSESNFNARIDEVTTAAPEIQARTEEALRNSGLDEASIAEASDYVSKLVSNASFDETTLDNELPVIADALRGSTDHFDALQRAADIITQDDVSDDNKLSAGLYLVDSIQKNRNLFLRDLPEAIQQMDDNDPALVGLRAFEDVIINIQSHPKIQSAITNAMRVTESNPIISDAELTPQVIKNAVGVATYVPENSNKELNERIVFQARNGDIQMTPEELATIEATQAMLIGAQQKQEAAAKLGIKTTDLVSEEIVAEDSSADYKSAAGHMKGIVSAVRAGNTDVAAARLQDMMLFAEHMQNKVIALNEHLKDGGGRKDTAVKYRALSGQRRWAPSATGLWVNPRAANSIRLAQQVALDASAVVTLANNLAETFPNLGVKKLDVVQLDESLNGPAQEVANLRNAQRDNAKRELQREKTEDTKTPVETPEVSVDNDPDTKSSSKGGDLAVADEVTDKPQTRRERSQEVSKLLENTKKGDLQSIEVYPDTKIPTEVGYHRFGYRTNSGELVIGTYTLDGSLIENLSIGDTNKPVDIGAAETRSIMEQLTELHPEVTVIQAFRMTGARAKSGQGPQEIWFDLSGGKFKLSRVDPRLDPAEDLTGRKINDEYVAFTKDSGTIGIPRADMPQIKSEARGALTNFLNARGITSTEETVDPQDLLPTQKEFSPAKVQKSKDYTGPEGDRAILVSEDGHVIDGHHQWLAARDLKEEIRIIRLNDTVTNILAAVALFPSNTNNQIPETRETSSAAGGAEVVEPNTVSNEEIETRDDRPGVGPQAQNLDRGAETDTDANTNVSAIEALFPNLVSTPDSKNQFLEAFKLPDEARSRLTGLGNVLQAVRKAISSNDAFLEFVGRDTNQTVTTKISNAYGQYLRFAEDIRAEMSSRLKANLAKPIAKGSKLTVGEALVNNNDMVSPATYIRGRVFSLVENGDYNQELQENAILAGLQWALTAEDQSRLYDAEDVAKILGIAEYEVTEDHIATFNTGLSLVDAKRSLSQKITSFWGVTENRNAPMGYTKGIPEGMASEVLYGLLAAGLIKIDNVVINNKKYPRVTVIQSDDKDARVGKAFAAMRGFPGLFETLALVEPEEDFNVGTAPEKVAEFQMRNNLVKNTKQQRDVIARQQKVPFYLNMPMVQFAADLTEDLTLALFGKLGLENPKINVNHKKSLEGYNLMITSAYATLSKVVAKIENHAETVGEDSDSIPTYFSYNVSRTGRLHQLGKNNPQSNKFMREMLLPTKATVDMTDQKYIDLFMLAVAQHWGVKVHKKFRADSVQQAIELADRKYPRTLEILTDWLVKNDEGSPLALTQDHVDTIRGEFDGDVSPAALHAAMEMARFRITPKDSLKEFTTSIYIEADGVTDGPINSLAHLAGGQFTARWLRVMAKGGLYIGNGIKTVNEYVQSGIAGSGNDVYQSVVNFLQEEIAERRNLFWKTNTRALEQFDALMTAMSDLLGSDISFNSETGELVLDRGITKNPVTVTIYGSGNAGIANKLTNELVKAIYERLSDGPPFTDDVNEALNAIFGKVAYQDFNTDKIVVQARETEPNFTKGSEFTLNKSELKNIQDNILELFVQPMKNAIDKVTGEVQTGKDYLLQTAQIQSIFLEHQFLAEVQKSMARKELSDPTWKKSDFLSQNELDEIYQKLRHVSPLVDTGTQSFLIAGSEKTDVPLSRFGNALDDTLQTPAVIVGPRNAGVKGIPTIVIGAGDGQMIQNYLADSNSPDGLPVFDGFNMSIADVETGSVAMNKAVYDGWLANPLRAVFESFRAFANEAEAGAIREMSQELKLDLGIALFGRKDGPKASPEMILTEIKNMVIRMEADVNLIEARKAVLSEINLSVDHMASAESPFQVTDKVVIEGDANDVAAELNRRLDEKLSQFETAKKEKGSADDIRAELGNYGVIDDKSKARVIAATQFRQMIEGLNIPDRQKAVLRDMYRGLASSNYKIVVGSLEQISDYADQNGAIAHAREYVGKGFEVSGYTDSEAKLIYMVNPSAETLAHEVVHAATMEKVIQYYTDSSLLSSEVREAIERIELLSKQWLLIPAEDVPHSARAEYNQIRATMNAFLSDGSPASALNEFMAWTLTNNALADVAENIAVSNPLARIAKKAWIALKELIFGKLFAPKVGNDIYSNLRFNSSVITTSTQTIIGRMNDTVAFQARGFGGSDRLTNIRQKFAGHIVKWFKSKETNTPAGKAAKSLRAVRIQSLLAQADTVVQSFVSNGFPMNMQQQTTFANILAAMATEMELNPNSLNRVQDLYVHVTNQLKVEDFMKDPTSTVDPNDRYQAQQKFNSIMGRNIVTKDAKGRSSLLPAFLALATVNDEFRVVLAKMQVPRNELNPKDSLDNIVENAGITLMDALTQRVSGSTKAAGDVREAIDILIDKIADNVDNEHEYITQFVTPVGNAIDKGNDFIVKWMNNFSDRIDTKLEDVKANTNSDMVRRIADVGILLSSVVSEQKSEVVARGVMSAMNKSGAWQTIQDLFNEFVGRTSENASVYDMIKQVRSFVQQIRQQYREELPLVINKAFSRKITEDEWTDMFKGLGKTDLAALSGNYQNSQVLSLLSDSAARQSEMIAIAERLQILTGNNWKLIDRKINDLVEYMNTGKVSSNLLRNAYSIAGLFGEVQPKATGTTAKTKQTVQVMPVQDVIDLIDHLTTLRAVEALPQATKDSISSLVQDEKDGVNFVYSYLLGQRNDDMNKIDGSVRGKINHYKGHVPSENKPGISLVVANDAEFDRLRILGYERVADYEGSRAERFATKKGYYFAPISGRAMYNQGIMQNVRQTAYGIDPNTGYSSGVPTAGRLTDPVDISSINQFRAANAQATEPLMPIYSDDGLVVAYERSMHADQLSRLEVNTNLSQAIGIWRGRQVEEANANNFNHRLIDNLKVRWDADRLLRSDEYIDLFDAQTLKDPVFKDAVELLTPDARRYIESVFGKGTFPVRRDMLNDAIGYRTPSVGDAWTGGSRWNQETQKFIQRFATGIFGVDAYRKFVTGEKFYQNFVQDAKVTIVVKSVIVPISNMISNVYQMSSRGVPLVDIARALPKKTAEVNSFMKNRLQQIELEAQLRAVENDPVKSRKLTNEIQSIKDANRRMSIWPLIAAGEFSSVSDAGISQDELLLAEGKLQSYIESLANKLPQGVRTAGRYAIVARNTALFKGLQRAVEYGDFLAKAVLYDDITKRLGKSKEYALSRITEEYVNYDRLAGRTRTYMDTMGLTWFWHFKIRSAKIAMATVRNNPLHLVLASAAPTPDSIGSIGMPLTDNMLSITAEGKLDDTVGPGMGLNAQFLNPWVQLFS